MKSSPVSLRRRQIVMAGLVGAVAPAAVYAGQCSVMSRDPLAPPTVSEVSTRPDGNQLIVSGRVIGGDCRPLAGALVEVWHKGSRARVTSTTDADGRFMLTTTPTVGGRLQPVQIRVSHQSRVIVAQRSFSPEPGLSEDVLARLYRDETGTWRTTVTLTVA